jgi:hypothetical protein
MNRIAFKANDQWGLPVRVKGVIQDSKGAVIDSFRSVHDGMGSFYLLPGPGVAYTAKWKDEKGNSYSTALPVAKEAGLSMQVSVSGKRRMVNLSLASGAPENLKQVHIMGTINQNIAFKTDASFSQNSTVRKIIPTESLPSGILTITVFDAAWKPVVERISFINNEEYSFPTSLEVNHWGLNKRARNEIQLKVPDSLIGANLSIAVTDASIESDTADNIISHLLLAADLKGDIIRPAYYFSNRSDSVAQHLDLVMLTHGWRRFKWEEVAAGKMPVISYPKDTTYLALSGKVYGVSKTQLTGTDNIVLLVKGKDSSLKTLIMPLESDGNFGDPNLILLDTINVYYKLKSKLFSNAEARFMTNRLPPPNYLQWSKTFLPYNPLFSDTVGNYRHFALAAQALNLTEAQKGKMMDMITVKTKTKTPVELLDEKYASGLFRNGDAYQFDLINDKMAIAYNDIISYLQGKVAGLQITMDGATPVLTWRGQSPVLYLDEMRIEPDFVTSVPVSDVAYIKVMRPPFFGTAGGGGGGAIAIYTKKGGDQTSSSGGLSKSSVVAYTPIRQFYSPNYERFDPKNEQADIRTTLYWNPQVLTTKKPVVLSFFNNDVSKSFRVVIEGMTREGMLTHYEQIME